MPANIKEMFKLIPEMSFSERTDKVKILSKIQEREIYIQAYISACILFTDLDYEKNGDKSTMLFATEKRIRTSVEYLRKLSDIELTSTILHSFNANIEMKRLYGAFLDQLIHNDYEAIQRIKNKAQNK